MQVLQPIAYEEQVRSLIDIWRFDGYLPDARSSSYDGRTQGGSNADNVLADAYVKGVRGAGRWIQRHGQRRTSDTRQLPRITSTGGDRNGDSDIYVRSLRVNGQAWTRNWLTWDDVFSEGGTLEFETAVNWTSGELPPSQQLRVYVLMFFIPGRCSTTLGRACR